MCDTIKQVQKAGDNSQQIQAQHITIINGIDEKRAREICDEKFQLIRNEFSQEAFQLANERVSKFEDILIPKMKQIQGALECFADPSFQYLISKAHRTAACSDKDSDLEILSELLIHRTQKKNSRNDIAGINRAVEIVDQITEEALNALTIFFAMKTYNPNATNLEQGLHILDNLYGKLPILNLPDNIGWIEELDVLDCIRFTTITKLKTLEEYWEDKYKGFVSVGIKIDSNKYRETILNLEKNNLPTNILIPNLLLDGYVIISVMRKESINDLQLIRNNGIFPVTTALTESQKECLYKIFDSYEKDAKYIKLIRDNFITKLDSFSNIKKCRKFWNGIKCAINVTSVGRALAHVNAKHYDSTLPDLN